MSLASKTVSRFGSEVLRGAGLVATLESVAVTGRPSGQGQHPPEYSLALPKPNTDQNIYFAYSKHAMWSVFCRWAATERERVTPRQPRRCPVCRAPGQGSCGTRGCGRVGRDATIIAVGVWCRARSPHRFADCTLPSMGVIRPARRDKRHGFRRSRSRFATCRSSHSAAGPSSGIELPRTGP